MASIPPDISRLGRWRCLFLVAALGALASCGGSAPTTSTDTAARGSGTVGIVLTDAPADPAMFAAINVTIESIHLLGGDEKVEVFGGPAQTFNLLDLTHEAVPFGYHNGVPAGEYCKIRLTLADLELVLADDTPDDSGDNETAHPHLPGNGKLDLVARDCFTVMPDGVLTLQIDLDAGKSIHVINNRNGFKFRPVVFVDVVDEAFVPRLVRLDGDIAGVDEAAGSLLLCDAVPNRWPGSRGCARLDFGDDAAFFDNETLAGAPRPLTELIDEDQLGKELVVVGMPRYGVLASPPHVGDESWPEEGQCRVWESGVAAEDQAEPIDCADVIEPLPHNRFLVTDAGLQLEPLRPLLLVDVLVAELGEFEQANGNVLVDADADGFTLDPHEFPGSGGDPLTVYLLAGGVDFNGTRIVTREGELLDFGALITPRSVRVDGVAELPGGAGSALRAALVIVNDSIVGDQVSGSVLALEDGAIVIDPDAAAVCGVATDTLLVWLDDNIEISTLTITRAGSELTPGGTVQVGASVGLSGACQGEDYHADGLLIIDDQTP